MTRFSQRKQDNYDNMARKNPEIKKALRYLESIHPTHSFLHSDQSFHFMKTCKKGNFERYYFYKGNDKSLIYIVLSFEESNKVKKEFYEKMGDDSYVYLDTVLSNITGNIVYHRFYRPQIDKKSIIFMSDDGKIFNESFLNNN